MNGPAGGDYDFMGRLPCFLIIFVRMNGPAGGDYDLKTPIYD